LDSHNSKAVEAEVRQLLREEEQAYKLALQTGRFEDLFYVIDACERVTRATNISRETGESGLSSSGQRIPAESAHLQ
jgi:hypothetical protein